MNKMNWSIGEYFDPTYRLRKIFFSKNLSTDND